MLGLVLVLGLGLLLVIGLVMSVDNLGSLLHTSCHCSVLLCCVFEYVSQKCMPLFTYTLCTVPPYGGHTITEVQ